MIKLNREAYFLEEGLIGFLRKTDHLSCATNKDIFMFLSAQIRDNPQLDGMKFCKEKTFYTWISAGRKEYQRGLHTKKIQAVRTNSPSEKLHAEQKSGNIV